MNSKALGQVGPLVEGLQRICSGGTHGLTALGSNTGQVCLADARQGFKAQQILATHSGGLTDMDLSGGLLATCGLGTRQGQLVADTIVKVVLSASILEEIDNATFAVIWCSWHLV